MLIAYDLVVPANTPKLSPVESFARLATGDLVRVGIEFKSGCAWMVSAAVSDELHQLVPVNQDGDIHTDDNILWSSMKYGLQMNPPGVTMRAWSPGTSFPHTLTFYFEVEPAGGQSWQDLFLQLFSSGPIHMEQP